MKLVAILLFSLFATSTIAQTDLPEIGTLTDISGKSRYYIVADAQQTKYIMKELKKQKAFTQVFKPEDAEFFIHYKTLNRETATSLDLLIETGQLDVYFMRSGRKVIA